MLRASRSANELRRRVYEILERDTPGDWASTVVARFIVLLIVVNLAAVESDGTTNSGVRDATLGDFLVNGSGMKIEKLGHLTYRQEASVNGGIRISHMCTTALPPSFSG